jgi:small-conductance mechanosensitive channel
VDSLEEIEEKSIKLKREKTQRGIFFLKIVLLAIFTVLGFTGHAKGYFGIPEFITDAMVFYLSSTTLVDFAKSSLINIYQTKNKINQGKPTNFVVGVNRIASVLHALFLLFFLLGVFKVDWKQVITSLTIFGAVIGLVMKEIFTNIVCGLLIMFGDQISIHDVIIVNEIEGEVIDVTLVNTVLRKSSQELVYVPNSNLLNSPVQKLKVSQKKPS